MSQKQNGSDGRMAIVLSRAVNVRCFHIVGEVGFAQRRDELRAVIQLAADRAGQITARVLCEHLLGGKPEAVGLRLLVVCERMGLVEWDTKVRRGDSTARLTEEGRRVAEGGDVFVPERGTWTVWVAEDPLIPVVERLLRVESFREPTAFDEVVGKKDKPREKRRTVDLPEWVQNACSVYGQLGWGDGRAISMLDIEAQGEPEEEAGAQVTLTLRAAPGEAPSIRLSGSIQGQRADYELKDAPAPTFDEVWRHCLGPRVGDWDGRKLAVRFANLSDTERNAFESHIGFDSWRHPVHGTFGGFQVPHVPIRPAADLDASLWANWLLAHRTQSYVRKADFAWRCEEVQEVFTGYRLQFMTQEQLAVSLRKTAGARPGRKYWHLKEPREDSEFDRKTYEAHKALLNRLAGHVLFRTAKSFHAKVVLVDPPTGEGYLLTANLTSEALERNEEVAVRLGAEECAQVREWLAHAFWEGAEHEMATPGALEAVRASGWAPRPESRGNVLATAPGHTGLCEAFRSLVDGARGQLVVTSFGWSKEHPVVQRIILLGFQWLHAKVVWSDAGEALVTSANLEPHGMDDGFELGVRLTGRLPLRDPAVVLPVRQEAGHTAYRARGLRVPHLPQRDPPSGARGARGYGLRPRAEVTRAARGTRFTPALRAE